MKHLSVSCLCGLLFAALPAVPRAASAATPADAVSESPARTIYVGLGAGYEAGNGIRLGMKRGADGIETGVGVVYLGETGELRYSFGVRYLRSLYEGAYAWIGAGRTGHRAGDDRGSLVSGGAGLGVSWRLGPMFRLMVDSGWRGYSDSDRSDGDLHIGPTFNGALVYEW